MTLKMTKSEAMREARIAVLYRGGTWYVTRKGVGVRAYRVVASDAYTEQHGPVAEIYTLGRVRGELPENVDGHKPLPQYSGE